MNTQSKSILLKSGLFVVVGWFAGTACFPLPFAVERPSLPPVPEPSLLPLCSEIKPEAPSPDGLPEITVFCRPGTLNESSTESSPSPPASNTSSPSPSDSPSPSASNASSPSPFPTPAPSTEPSASPSA